MCGILRIAILLRHHNVYYVGCRELLCILKIAILYRDIMCGILQIAILYRDIMCGILKIVIFYRDIIGEIL